MASFVLRCRRHSFAARLLRLAHLNSQRPTKRANNRPVVRWPTILNNSYVWWHSERVPKTHLRARPDTQRFVPRQKRPDKGNFSSCSLDRSFIREKTAASPIMKAK